MNDRTASAVAAWQEQLAEIAFNCAAASTAEAADLILATRDLLASAPGEWGRRFAGLPDRAALAALIAAGATTTAALSLVEGRAGFLLSQAQAGCPLATVVIEGLTGEASAEGDCLATALLGALTAALAGPALKLQGAQSVSAPAPGVRLN
ncbi:hypothetical protein [Novosphingobium sp.]|uniref:hypothetical protein n=1 Tax=Novosphingobium sp. TaxID=1874826 RepID=UPI0035B0A834